MREKDGKVGQSRNIWWSLRGSFFCFPTSVWGRGGGLELMAEKER